MFVVTVVLLLLLLGMLVQALVAVVPWLMIVSVLVTLVHTYDEIDEGQQTPSGWTDTGGPIWDYLIRVFGLSWASDRVVAIGYFLFQSVVVSLPIIGFGLQLEWVLWLLVAIRLFDFGFTHTLLAFWWSPNPGSRTRWLLLADAVLIGSFLVW